MEERTVHIGPLEILLPDFATGESVKEETSGLTSLVVVLAPVVLSIWHAEGQLNQREAFLAKLLKELRPKRHERTTFVLGGCRFDGIAMSSSPSFGEESHIVAGVADFFGDFVCVARTYRGVPPEGDALDRLLNSMVQGMIVRRQRTLSPDVLRAWMARQTADASSPPASPDDRKPWWKLW